MTLLTLQGMMRHQGIQTTWDADKFCFQRRSQEDEGRYGI